MELQKMYVTLAMNSANFKAGIADAQKAANGFADKAKTAFGNLKSAILPIGVALGAVAVAAKAALESFKRGAELELARSRFENLTASIGTTADVMLTKMRDATRGMISDAELMASGSDIISLGLAKTEEQAVRLASVVGQLGWDMQQVILTFANNSTMRLDALGLSVADVTARAKELEAAGYSMDEAFDLAVIEAGEKKLGLLGSAADTTAGKIKQLEAMWANARDGFDQAFAEGVADEFERITGAAEGIGPALTAASGGLGTLLSQLTGVLATGLFTNPTFLKLLEIGLEQQAQAADQQAAVDAIKAADYAMESWADTVENAGRKTEELEHIFTGVTMAAADLDWQLRVNAYQVEDAAVATTEYAADLTVWSDNAGIAYHQAMQFGAALGYNADEANRAAEALAAYNAAFIQEVPDYTTELPGADKPLVSPERTVSFTSGGLSREQITLAEEYTARIEKLNEKIYDLTNGIGTYGMSQDQINEKVAAAQGEVAHYQALLAPLAAQTGEVSTAQQGMTVNVDATRQAIFDQLVQAGAAPEVIGAYGVAIGVMTMEQAEAALTAAAVRVKIEELAKKIAEGMPVDQALADLDEFIVKVEGGMVPSVETARGEMIDQMGGLAIDLGLRAKEAGQNAMIGLQDGIAREKQQAIVAAEQAAQDVIDGTNGAFQIQSPSRVFWNIGGNLMEGLRQGMQAAVGAVISAVTSIGTSVVQGLVNGINAAKGLVQAAIQSIAGAIPDWLRQFLDSRSPSRKTIPIGEDIAAGIIVGIKNKELDLYETLKEMFDIAGTFGNLASGFGQEFGRQAIDPIAESIDALNEQIPELEDKLDKADEAVATFGGRAAEILEEMGLGGMMNDPQLWSTLRRYQQSNDTWVRTQATAALDMLNAQALALMDQSNLQNEITGLNDEIIAQQEEMARQQERLAEIEQKRADIAFLQQQFDLLQLIKDNKLDANLLDGITLGLEADAGALMDAMVDAMQQMIQAAEDELGIASPSKWARGLMENVFETMADTAAYEARLLETGMEYALSPSLDIWDVPRGGSSSDNRRINYGGYHVHVNTAESEPLEYLWEVSR